MVKSFRSRLRQLVFIPIIVAAYLLILRGAIEFFHPKDGGLLYIVDFIFGRETAFWAAAYVSHHCYGFLTQSIWGDPVIFYSLLSTVFIFSVFLTKTKIGKNA